MIRNSDFSYAEKLANDGYIDLAIAQYKDFLARFPNDTRAAEAARRIADGYLQIEQFGQARDYYQRLSLQYNNSPFASDAIFKIGECYAGEGEWESAAQQYERFAILNASQQIAADAYLRAGQLYLRAGDRIRGRKALFEILENFPENQNALAGANAVLIGDYVDSSEYNRAFSAVNAYLQRFAEHTATPDIWLIKAELHQKLGQISETITTLENLRKQHPKSTAATQAGLQLAQLHFKMGDRGQAQQLLEQVKASASNDSIHVEIALLQAGILLDDEKASEAAAQLRSAINTRNLTLQQSLHAARLFAAANDDAQAVTQYEKATRAVSVENDSIRALVALRLGRAAYRLGNGAKALQAARSISALQQPFSLRADFKLLLADLYFELYQDPARAARHYAEFVESYPEHTSIDDAQAKLARSYEALQQWNMAEAEWRRLLQNYPASPHSQNAQNHLELLQRYFLPDYLNLVESTIENLSSTGIAPDLRQAEIYYRFRQFQKAIPMLKSTIAKEEATGTRAQAMYLLGKCYFALADIATVEQRPQAAALFDSANVLLRHVYKQYASQIDAEPLHTLLAQIALKTGRASLAELDSISRRHENDAVFADVHHYVLPRILPAIATQDSAIQSFYLQRVNALGAFANGRWNNQAVFLRAQLALQQKDSSRALLELEKIVNGDRHDSIRGQAALLHAKLLAAKGAFDTAISRLDAMRFAYHYSALADSALFYMAQFSYQKGQFKATIDYLQQLRERRFLAASEHTGQTLWSEAVLLEADALAKAGNALDAIGSYLTFAQKNPAANRAGKALIALGELAENFYATNLAKSYYSDVIKLYPQRLDDVNRAKTKLVDLEFRLGNYQIARTLALNALQSNLSFADEMEMTKIAIIANLRQNSAQTADDEIKNFKNKFDDKNQAYAEIQYEYGDFYIRQKNFRRADRIFKEVGDKFEGTELGIQGQFGYGKSLLFQAKTEDALEVLTEIPRDYPDHPFLRVVYLNLGDFYLDQQQWGNAIQAFNNVLADSVHDQYQKAALAKMSELYQSTGMSDACMTYTRKYIELFPREENVMIFKMRIGSLLRDMKRYDEAIAHYRELVPLANGENAIEIQYYIGDSYFEARKYELAIGEFLKLRYTKLDTKLPWRTTAVYKAGEAYMRINNYERAREMYDYVVRSEGVNSQLGNFAFRKIAQIDEMLKSTPQDVTKS